MRLLLDTHVFMWASSNDVRLKPVVREAIAAQTNVIFVSAASAWEIGIKHASGRLTFPVHKWDEMVTTLAGLPLPITAAHGLEAGALPRHHQDPFDRLLIAQARLEGLTLVTADRTLNRYDVVIFAG